MLSAYHTEVLPSLININTPPKNNEMVPLALHEQSITITNDKNKLHSRIINKFNSNQYQPIVINRNQKLSTNVYTYHGMTNIMTFLAISIEEQK